MASAAENLATIKTALLATLAAETTAQQSRGPKPSYSLDGESYQWTEWREAVLRKVETLNKLIQYEDGAFEIRSFGRV